MSKGFSTLELAIAVSLVAILATLMLTMGNMTKQVYKTETTHNLQQLSQAMVSYLEHNASLGKEIRSEDFIKDPIHHLEKYIQLNRYQIGLIKDPKTKPLGPTGAKLLHSTAIRDVDGNQVVDRYNHPIIWKVLNEKVRNRIFTYYFEMRAQNGTPKNPDDDIIVYYNSLGTSVIVDGNTMEPTNGGIVFLDDTIETTPTNTSFAVNIPNSGSSNSIPSGSSNSIPEETENTETEPEDTPSEEPTTNSVSGNININPGNSNKVLFTFVKPDNSKVTSKTLKTYGSNYNYSGPVKKVSFKPKSTPRTLTYNGQDYKLKTNTKYTIVGDDLEISISNAMAGAKYNKSNGHWFLTVSGDDVTITPPLD